MAKEEIKGFLSAAWACVRPWNRNYERAKTLSIIHHRLSFGPITQQDDIVYDILEDAAANYDSFDSNNRLKVLTLAGREEIRTYTSYCNNAEKVLLHGLADAQRACVVMMAMPAREERENIYLRAGMKQILDDIKCRETPDPDQVAAVFGAIMTTYHTPATQRNVLLRIDMAEFCCDYRGYDRTKDDLIGRIAEMMESDKGSSVVRLAGKELLAMTEFNTPEAALAENMMGHLLARVRVNVLQVQPPAPPGQ